MGKYTFAKDKREPVTKGTWASGKMGLDGKIHGIFLLIAAFGPHFTGGGITRCFFDFLVSSCLFAEDLNLANGLRYGVPQYIREKIDSRHFRGR